MVGIPQYIKEAEISQYASYRITKAGWYSFVRVSAPNGVTVKSGFAISGIDTFVQPSNGANHVDVAVPFSADAMTVVVGINWGQVTESVMFKATDLAVRNLDYRTTFYIYDAEPYAKVESNLITFSGFTPNITYRYNHQIDRPINIVLP